MDVLKVNHNEMIKHLWNLVETSEHVFQCRSEPIRFCHIFLLWSVGKWTTLEVTVSGLLFIYFFPWANNHNLEDRQEEWFCLDL